MSYRGNKDKVAADARRIVQRLREGATVMGICRQYRCAYLTLRAALLGVSGKGLLSRRDWSAICKRNLAGRGVQSRFKPGHEPWSKGVKGLHLSAATEFKPGCIRGAAARKYRAVGTISVRRDSVSGKRGRPRLGKRRRFIKIKDWGKPQDRWIPYARWLWRKHRGPIGEGRFVVHVDGDTMNDDLANLRVVDQREHLAAQQRRDPERMITTRLRRSSAANKKRYAAARLLKQFRQSRFSRRTIQQCAACAYDGALTAQSQRCPKCGCGSFVEIRLPRAAGA